jgi:hypothetical protein
MTILAALVVVLGVAFALFAAMVSWERQGNSARAVAVIIVAVVVDAASGPGFDRGSGLLHPHVGSLTFRLPDVLIVLALLARLLARGLPQRIGLSMLWWIGFTLWYLAAGVMGVVAGNDTTPMFFEAKLLIYMVGGFALASGVPSGQLAAMYPRLLRFIAVIGLAVFVLDQSGVSVTAAIPLVPLDHFGEMGGDAATVFVTFGVLALMSAAVDRENRRGVLLCALPLVIAPFATDQRAALIDLAAALLVLIACWLVPRVSMHVRTTTTELVLLLLMVVAALLAPSTTTSATQETKFKLPLSAEFQSAFDNQAKLQSAQSRSNQWEVARGLILDRPFIGWGLGKQYRHYEQGVDEVISTDITHDIAFDVLLRAGSIGLGLLLVALWSTGTAAWKRLREMDDLAAGVAVGAAAAVVGILGKGLVESIFEKYLVATVLGLMLGTVRAMTTGPALEAGTAPTSEELGSAWN